MSFQLGRDGKGKIYVGDDQRIHLRGIIFNVNEPCMLEWWAANSADHRTSYTGSGLPFPNPQVAYENTPNIGAVRLTPSVVKGENNAKFDFVLYSIPNAYYVGNGSIYLSPRVNIRLTFGKKTNQYEVVINTGIPYRHLSYVGQPNVIARSGPEFYKGRFKLPFATQEDILRRSAYPSKHEMPTNFWGLATPHP
tara:strand:+ start:9771 stop:10352 length:582 start_codon:yes stop_codon:yes gene_type:complete